MRKGFMFHTIVVESSASMQIVGNIASNKIPQKSTATYSKYTNMNIWAYENEYQVRLKCYMKYKGKIPKL